jgi:hypothetical protein
MVLQGCNSIPLLDRALQDLSARSNGVRMAWEVWELKAENFITHLFNHHHSLPTTAYQHAHRRRDPPTNGRHGHYLSEDREGGEGGGEEGRGGSGGEKKADAEEAEQKKKEAKAENDRVQKARVRALAELKKDKPVDKAAEPGEGSEGRKECDSCSKKGRKCEWITVSHLLLQSFGSDYLTGGLLHPLAWPAK